MTIGDRIKILRKEKKLTQAEFAEKIGLKATAIGMYEKNLRNVSEQSITLIIQVFNVSETWLRYGKGDMYTQTDNQIVEQLIKQYHMSPEQEKVMKLFLSMSDEKRQLVAQAFFAFLDEAQRQKDEIDKEVEDYRQELLAEREGVFPFATGNEKIPNGGSK